MRPIRAHDRRQTQRAQAVSTLAQIRERTEGSVTDMVDNPREDFRVQQVLLDRSVLLRRLDVALGALEEALETDGGTSYAQEDDSVGGHACCGAVSYHAHKTDCWVPKARAAIRDIDGRDVSALDDAVKYAYISQRSYAKAAAAELAQLRLKASDATADVLRIHKMHCEAHMELSQLRQQLEEARAAQKILASAVHRTWHFLDDWASENGGTGDVEINAPAYAWKKLNDALEPIDDMHESLHEILGIGDHT